MGDGVIVHDIRVGQAKGAVNRSGARHDDPLDAQLPGEDPRQQGTGPAEGVQDEVPRVQAPLHGDLVDQVGDLRIGHPEHAYGGLLDAQAQRAGDLFPERLFGGGDIQGHGAVEETPGVQVA